MYETVFAGMRQSTHAAGEGGYTLYLVMVLLSIAGTLFGITMVGSTQTHLQAVDYSHEIRAMLLAQSGLERASFFYNGGDGHSLYWESPRLKEEFPGIGELVMSSSRFGAFSRMRSVGICRRRESVIAGLAGRSVPQNLAPAITLTGHTGSIVFTKGTSVSGTVVLHHGSIKDGNKRPIRGMQDMVHTRQSPAMPFDCDVLLAVLRDAENVREIISSRKDAVARSVAIHSADDSLLMKDTLFVNGNCTISGAVLDNKRIIAAGDVSLGHNALLRNSTIIGRRVTVEESALSEYSLVCSSLPITVKGGSHNSQFFSGDSIAVENTPTFGDMTVMFSHRTAKGDSAWSGGIVFKEKAACRGTYICFTDTTKKISSFRRTESIVFPSGSEVHGSVITNGAVKLHRSTVRGHIWAEKIHAEDDEKSYTNWLFGCRIAPPTHEPVFPLLGAPPARVAIKETERQQRRLKIP